MVRGGGGGQPDRGQDLAEDLILHRVPGFRDGDKLPYRGIPGGDGAGIEQELLAGV